MPDKQKEIEEMSDIQDTVARLIKKYNKIATAGNHETRLAYMTASFYVKDYLQENEEPPKNINEYIMENDINPYVSISSDEEAYAWFPSGFCPGY